MLYQLSYCPSGVRLAEPSDSRGSAATALHGVRSDGRAVLSRRGERRLWRDAGGEHDGAGAAPAAVAAAMPPT